MINTLRYLFFVITLFALQVVCAQIPDDFGYHKYKEKFPKESFVFLEIEKVDVFDINDHELEIYTKSKEKILCLNYNAIGLKERSIGYDQFSSLEDVTAYSLYPSNGKYKKAKVKEFKDQAIISNGISFYDDSRERKFEYEYLREGAVTVLEYKRRLKDPHLLYTRSFSSGLFIKEETYTAKVHKDINMGFREFNMDREKINYSSWEDGDYIYHKWYASKDEKETIYGSQYYRLYYEPHIIPYIQSYTINGNTTNVFRNLDDLYNWYYSLLEQIEPLKNDDLKLLADSITKEATSDLEKVKRIYYWVQDRIKYIAFGDGYGGFVPRNPDLIYERKFGDCKDMTCLIVNLLDQVDIKAYFSWVGTRKIPYSYSEVADPSVDNHMIATYIAEDGEKYYLDATNANLTFGRPSSFIQGKEILISKSKDEYELEKVPVLSPELNSEIDSVQIYIEETTLKGTGKYLFTGYLAEEVYEETKDLSPEELVKRFKSSLTKGSNKFFVKKVNVERPNNSKDSLQMFYEFEIDSYINKINNSLYLNLNLSKQFKSFEFDKKQNVPVVLDYKNYLKKVFVLAIPAEYQVEFIPDNFEMENDLLSSSILYTVKNNRIEYQLEFKQKVFHLEVEEIADWNELISELSQHLDESIKLKKR